MRCVGGSGIKYTAIPMNMVRLLLLSYVYPIAAFTLKHTGKEELKWADGRYLFILSSSPGADDQAWPAWGLLVPALSPTLAIASCGMKSHFSPYSNDADVRNDKQKTIWVWIQSDGKPCPDAKKKLRLRKHPRLRGASKFGDGGLLAVPVLRDSAPTCTNHTLMSGPTRFFALSPFSRYSHGPSSRFDLQKIAPLIRSWRLPGTPITVRPINTNLEHPIGFRPTSPVWRLCDHTL